MVGMAEYESLQYLKRQQVKIVPMKFVQDIEEALDFADEIDFPVVLKASIKDLYHKTELGLVKVNISDRKMLKDAWVEIQKSINRAGKKYEGMLVQKMLKGTEIIIGAMHEEQFGPMVMAGTGGIYTEVFKDVAFRLAPIDMDEALRMLAELKIFGVLEGARGQDALCINGLAEIIVNVSQIINKKEIKEIDLNPVIISREEAVVADALIIRQD